MVFDLSSQLDIFNAMLGVIPDHGKIPKSIIARDSTTGEEIKISADKSVLTSPRIISQEPYSDGVRAVIGFPDHESKNK